MFILLAIPYWLFPIGYSLLAIPYWVLRKYLEDLPVEMNVYTHMRGPGTGRRASDGRAAGGRQRSSSELYHEDPVNPK